jgi:phospholipase/carboxylesterase
MKRIPPSLLPLDEPPLLSASAASSPDIGAIESGIFSPALEASPYALFAPLHYERNYAYPLLIWLHGADDDESQLKRIMPLVSLRNYVAVAPRGTLATTRPDRTRPTYTWGQTAADVGLAEQRVFDSLSQIQQRFHIHGSRIFLGGFDVGGTMAFRLAMSHPDDFAGVLSLSGAFPTGRTPLNRLNEVRRVPLLMACGSHSSKYPPERVCEDLRLFHAAGMDITVRQYPCGHEISPDMLADVDRWMMEQILDPADSQ